MCFEIRDQLRLSLPGLGHYSYFYFFFILSLLFNEHDLRLALNLTLRLRTPFFTVFSLTSFLLLTAYNLRPAKCSIVRLPRVLHLPVSLSSQVRPPLISTPCNPLLAQMLQDHFADRCLMGSVIFRLDLTGRLTLFLHLLVCLSSQPRPSAISTPCIPLLAPTFQDDSICFTIHFSSRPLSQANTSA